MIWLLLLVGIITLALLYGFWLYCEVTIRVFDFYVTILNILWGTEEGIGKEEEK